jgi:predicted DNA-binding transcriptional regulator AlpA
MKIDRPKIEPLGLSRSDSAQYVGVSASKFDEMVKDGRMPAPKRVNSRVIWDRLGLDQAFENLPEGDDENPWDQVEIASG